MHCYVMSYGNSCSGHIDSHSCGYANGYVCNYVYMVISLAMPIVMSMVNLKVMSVVIPMAMYMVVFKFMIVVLLRFFLSFHIWCVTNDCSSHSLMVVFRCGVACNEYLGLAIASKLLCIEIIHTKKSSQWDTHRLLQWLYTHPPPGPHSRPPPRGQTNTFENITFPQLHWQAVTILKVQSQRTPAYKEHIVLHLFTR